MGEMKWWQRILINAFTLSLITTISIFAATDEITWATAYAALLAGAIAGLREIKEDVGKQKPVTTLKNKKKGKTAINETEPKDFWDNLFSSMLII